LLNKKVKFLLITVLALAIIIPTQINLVHSSIGAIRINRTTASALNQQVEAGGNVNLYFGDPSIIWSGNQFYLLLSHDLSTTVSSGDYIYSAKFSVANLQNPTSKTSYTNGEGTWTIGNNWVNGTFASNMPAGAYSVKAFDFGEAGSDTDTCTVAVTDTFINVLPKTYETTFEINPKAGPGGITAQFSGTGYEANKVIDVAYYDPTYGEYRAWKKTLTDSSGGFSFSAEIPDLGKSNYQGDNPETYNRLQYKTHYQGLAYSYATYDQYAKGLKTIGSYTANGLYGNSSNLVSSVRVKAGETFTITGKWFQPGTIYVLLDSEATVGTVTSSQWNNAMQIGNALANSQGYFEATVTIPNTIDGGEHYIAVEDSESTLIVKILITSGTLEISPSAGPGGANVQFTGSGYPAGSAVDISYRDEQYGSWNYWTTLNSDSSGKINLNVEIPDLGKACYSGDSYNASSLLSFRSEVNGRVFAYADYTQYARGLKQVGTQTAYYLFGDNTNFANYNFQVRPGDSLTISGQFFHPGVVYIRWDGKEIVGTVTADQWRSATIIGQKIANAVGSFETTVTIPTADNGNHWVSIEDSQENLIIQLQVSDSAPPLPTPTPTPPTPTPTTTPTPSQNPTPTPTSNPNPTPTPTTTPTPTIDISCKSTSTTSGFKVEINGILSYNNTGLSDKAVQLYYSKDGGKNWESLTLVNTGGDGKFNAVWISPASGIFLFKAECAAGTGYNQATSIVNFAIEPALTDNDGETVFTMTSNSTISQLDFKSETSELSFVASGDTNTKGYVSVNIPKTLISDISNLKVYLDGSEVTFNCAQETDSWTITITYSHSIHRIVMALSSNPNQNQQSTNQWIFIGASIIALAIVSATIVAVLNKKRFKR
jgi:hypothetical protein